MIKYLLPLLFLALLFSTFSCKVYKRDILFKTEGMPDSLLLKAKGDLAYKNYKILPFDWIDVRVQTNNGEALIDPNFELRRQINGANGMMMGGMQNGAMGGGGVANAMLIGTINPNRYLVNSDGAVTLPLIGRVQLAGLTYRQADSLLAERFSNFYEDAFVVCRTSNRRCIVISGSGGLTLNSAMTTGQVVSLPNEGLSLIEVLALAGGIPAYSDASNIRVIRGDLRNPRVSIINLQTINSMREADLRILPNDIIYVEPVRRPAIDALRDIAPLISTSLSLLTLFIVFFR